jgi:shikimate kinase
LADSGALEAILLIGPPGSGKTAIGYELAERHGFRYTDYEAGLVERYGPVELFVRHKNRAIPELHRTITASLDANLPPLVIETTALSEREFIDGLIASRRTFTVLLNVSLETALARIGERPRGRNLSNSPGTNEWIWERFADAHRERQADLRIDTEAVTAEEAARRIAEAVGNGE